ncbi:MAG TPA: serine hydrolase domain-containing protein [Bacteroidota bacterium]|nr:serine hydrolase domain-containing protein [Bacteroidota bacterium]
MKVKIISYCAVLTVAIAMTCGSRSDPTDHGTPHQAVIHALDSCMRVLSDSGFSGVVLVARLDTILLHQAYDRQGKAADTSTAFWLASNSKQFTAAAILKLQEQRLLSVHDSIARFFPNVPPDKRGITIHHLLSHTSGIGHNYIAEGITDRDTLVARILSAPLARPVGEQEYSSDAYDLLGAIIEIASLMSYEQYLRQNLFLPAGMQHTGFWGYESKIPVVIAPAHDSLKSMPFYARMFQGGKPKPNWGCRGGSGIFSTTGDMFRWIRALESGRILSVSSRRLLLTPHSLIRHDDNNVDVAYGYGWIVSTQNGKRIEYRHGGREDWLANSFIRVFADGDIIITFAYDFGPNANAMSVMAAKQLAIILQEQHAPH